MRRRAAEVRANRRTRGGGDSGDSDDGYYDLQSADDRQRHTQLSGSNQSHRTMGESTSPAALAIKNVFGSYSAKPGGRAADNGRKCSPSRRGADQSYSEALNEIYTIGAATPGMAGTPAAGWASQVRN